MKVLVRCLVEEKKVRQHHDREGKVTINPRYDERYKTRREYDGLNNDEHDFAKHDWGTDGDDYDNMTAKSAKQYLGKVETFEVDFLRFKDLNLGRPSWIKNFQEPSELYGNYKEV